MNLGVDLRFRHSPPLHSKVYWFQYREGDEEAFVGSANMTTGGLSRNDETVARFLEAADITKVTRELDRLSGLGTLPFRLWRARKH